MATTSQAAKQLSDGNSQGTIMGQSATDLIGFYGTAAVGKPGRTGTSLASLSNSSGAFVSSIAAALNALGLIQCTSGPVA
jgi:hypothetical protein